MTNILNLKKELEEKKETPVLKNNQSEKIVPQKKKVIKKPRVNFEWAAPEFEYYEKNRSWLTIVIAFAIVLFIIALITKNFLFGLLILISAFLIITYSLKKPDDVKISITPKGVKVNNAFYEFDNLRSFWIFYDPPEIKELSIRSKKTIMPYVKIPIGNKNPAEIRKHLIKYLPEKKHKESVIDNLARQAKF